jgi:hypothetical protein
MPEGRDSGMPDLHAFHSPLHSRLWGLPVVCFGWLRTVSRTLNAVQLERVCSSRSCRWRIYELSIPTPKHRIECELPGACWSRQLL